MQEWHQKQIGGPFMTLSKFKLKKSCILSVVHIFMQQCSILFFLLLHFSSAFGKPFADYLGYAANG